MEALRATFYTPHPAMFSTKLWDAFDASRRTLEDTRMLPFYISCASTFIVLLQFCHLRNHQGPSPEPGKPLTSNDTDATLTPVGAAQTTPFKKHVAKLGGPTIFAWNTVRALGCFSLLGISVTPWTKSWMSNGDGHLFDVLRQSTSIEKAVLATSKLYFSSLALATVACLPQKSNIAERHLILVLLVSLGVYIYRDLWPLFTYTDTPMDLSEGSLLWLKIGILTVSGALVPLLVPRKYSPVNPKDPMPEPNPEQTAPLLSLAFYGFLDSIILLAYGVPHLAHSQLPPLADSDYSKNLTKYAFPHLDPARGAKQRHIFFSLMRVLYLDYAVMAIMIIVQVLAGFAAPIGINRLLGYVETHGAGAEVRPWSWIVFLFVGPIVASISRQWYIFVSTRALVRTEAIITQLVFEHSLRIRLKADAAESTAHDTANTSTAETLHTPFTPMNYEQTSQDGSADGTSHSSGEGSKGTMAETSREGSDNLSVSSSSSRRGKQKMLQSGLPPPKSGKATAESNNLIGKINNLVTTDLGNIAEARDFLQILLLIPLQVSLCIIFLHAILGWSSFAGLGVMIVLFPVPGYFVRLIQGAQVQRMKMTDARVQTVSETMNVLRMIKVFGWESQMIGRIEKTRGDELRWLWTEKVYDLTAAICNYLIPTVTMVVTYGTYTLIMKKELNASIVFSSMMVFSMLRTPLLRITSSVMPTIQGKVSLDRLNKFLGETELLDSFSNAGKGVTAPLVEAPSESDSEVGFRDAEFAWSEVNGTDGTLTPSKRTFRLRINGELYFKHGKVNLIIGPTGSGKTSMLMALLGEMHFLPSSPQSWFGLPRVNGVAYAAQESWVQNATIRENILFGSPYNKDRYKDVIRQCGLEPDLKLFDAGDDTEVGERGLTLSGGQKARVTLARAIYSPAEIILLDDVLAALDVHTSKWIVDKCFKGHLVRGRTLILVTHNIALASPIADFIVSISSDGTVSSQGSDISVVLAQDRHLAREAKESQQLLDTSQDSGMSVPIPENSRSDGKLVVAEEIAQGHLSWTAVRLFLSGLSGSPITFMAFICVIYLAADLSHAVLAWYLGHWASQYDDHPASDVNVPYYLGTYTALLTFSVILYLTVSLIYMVATFRASKKIHHHLIVSVLGTTLRWLDSTPTSRVITRCTQDIRALDGPIPETLKNLTDLTGGMIVRLGGVVLYSPLFLIPGVFMAVIGGYMGNIYLKAQLSVKREMSNAKAPVMAHFSAAIGGLISIRAFGAEDAFRTESLKRIDHYTRAARVSYNLNRWIAVRIDILGAMFSTALVSYLVYGPRSPNSATIGFSMNMAFDFCTIVLWWVRVYNDFEVQGNSLERIHSYTGIEQEPPSTEAGKPPAAWPTSGDLRVEKLSARYSADGPEVLHDISFHLHSGERVGIVGRTGSGKSSLTLSLLRCILTDGSVHFDGLSTSSINLQDLRSSITIIPQVPEMLSGTLRRNLDPFEEHEDATLNDALRAAGLFALQKESDLDRITLDSNISSGGSNLSVGQRQILALARAIVRGSKLLILDEATSAIDYKTDAIIQETLRNQPNDLTLITVAHRLQTIMDADRIMVLDSGRIAEFASPQELLKNEKGLLRSLVDESEDKEVLYAMAYATAESSTGTS